MHPIASPALRLARPLLASLLVALVACGDTTDDGDPDVGTDTGGGRQDTGGGTADGSDPEVGPVCDLRPCADQGDSPTDSDGDGIPDCVEGDGDANNNGVPNCLELDSDGDGIPDAVEGTGDSDGDGIPDYLDLDSDGDGILDKYEGTGDPDEDGIPNYLDLDSDGDGVPDSIEFGREPGTDAAPIDRDNDGVPDFLDLDTDGDGIPDADEPGCPEGPDRLRFDSDGDGVTDLIEITFGSDPCDPTSDVTGLVDFYFVLPYQGEGQEDLLPFGTDVRQADVVMQVDTTGSMSGAIETLRDTLSTFIIPGLQAQLDDVAIGITRFDDFPCGDYGGGNDIPFELLQRVTTSATAAQGGVDRMTLHNGGDGPESSIEALYQLATGVGSNDCRPGVVPAFNPLTGLVAGVADGVLGGAGFRRGAVPIAVHVTDAVTQARGEGGYPYGATRTEAYAAAEVLGLRVIGVANGNGGLSDLTEFAVRTGATVPPCAFDATRDANCAAGQCCTGPSGRGVPPNAGQCPLVFQISANGSGLNQSILDGIEALVNFAPLDITTQVRPDPAELSRSGIDTSCFIQAVTPDAALPRGGVCASQPTRVDFDGNGVDDGFAGVSPGSQVFFNVQAQNDCVTPRTVPQTFLAYIDVVAGGSSVLDTRVVTILVPPEFKE